MIRAFGACRDTPSNGKSLDELFDFRTRLRSHLHKLAPASTDKMGKRSVFDANPKAAHTGHHAKRQRTDGSHEREIETEAPVAEVTSAQQLQRSLVFDQGNVAALRQGM